MWLFDLSLTDLLIFGAALVFGLLINVLVAKALILWLKKRFKPEISLALPAALTFALLALIYAVRGGLTYAEAGFVLISTGLATWWVYRESLAEDSDSAKPKPSEAV